MIKFTDVSFGFPQKELYNKICFEIEKNEHAVLIGSNGTGKSTLVDMIMNKDDYLYDGKIEMEPNIRIGYVSQFVKHEDGDISSYDYLSKPFIELQAKADEVCAQMENADDMEAAYEKYQECLDEIEAVDGYNFDTNIKKRLAVAGINELENISVNKISGGEFKLLSIIRNMLLKPQLLIMDEPDVFLDFENIVGLSKLINSYEGTILVITHSRLLLSQCFDKILHIENEELQEFPGTFAEYNYAMLETKIQMQEQATKDEEWIETQKKLVERMRADASKIANSTKGRQLKARVSYLERLQKKKTNNPFIEEHDYDFTFPKLASDEEDNNGENELVFEVKNYSLTYDKTILSDVNFEIKKGEKVAIVGANGTGKSSLLQDVYAMLKEKDSVDQIGFFTQIYDDDEEKLSGGERNIKQLHEIAKGYFSILFLDEPTSHLDTYAQIALEKAIAEYKGTVLMVSHDFYTVVNCADRILILENGTLREMSARAYRKSIYKRYFDSDIFEAERIRKEKEIRINALLKSKDYENAWKVLKGE